MVSTRIQNVLFQADAKGSNMIHIIDYTETFPKVTSGNINLMQIALDQYLVIHQIDMCSMLIQLRKSTCTNQKIMKFRERYRDYANSSINAIFLMSLVCLVDNSVNRLCYSYAICCGFLMYLTDAIEDAHIICLTFISLRIP